MLVFMLIYINGIRIVLFKICYQLAPEWRDRKALAQSSSLNPDNATAILAQERQIGWITLLSLACQSR